MLYRRLGRDADIDAMIYDEATHTMMHRILRDSEDFLTEITLGKNWFTDGKDINKACVAFSPNADSEIDRMYLSIALRTRVTYRA